MPEQVATKITNTNSESLLLVNSLIGELATAFKEAALMRVDQRYALDRKVLIGKRRGQNQFLLEYEAWGGDISNNGLALFTTRPFPQDSISRIILRSSAEEPMFATIQIRRCQKLTEHIYRIGATFVFEDNFNRPA